MNPQLTAVLGTLSHEPLAIEETGLVQWLARIQAAPALTETNAGLLEDLFGKPPVMKIKDGVATIPIAGALMKRPSKLEQIFGAASYDEIAANIDRAVSERVRQINFDVSSPGGAIRGMHETAETIAGLKQKGIRTIAFSDTMAASAAYALICSCDEIAMSPSATTASVGVITELVNFSEALKAAGITVHVFTSGRLKAAGHSKIPLTKDGREHIQGRVDEMGKEFRARVKKHRPDVHDSEMEGQSFDGKRAFSFGFIDTLTSDFSAILQGQSSGKQSSLLHAAGRTPGTSFDGTGNNLPGSSQAEGLKPLSPLELGEALLANGRARICNKVSKSFSYEDWKKAQIK